jgi:sRNA-binding carbon storage regulator CsrA
VLSRRIGESIKVGDETVFTVVSVGPRSVVLAVNTPRSSRTVALAYDEVLRLDGDRVGVMLAEIDRGKVRLAVTAPREIPIMRTELLPIDEAKRP